jgi:hypothetical protein
VEPADVEAIKSLNLERAVEGVDLALKPFKRQVN